MFAFDSRVSTAHAWSPVTCAVYGRAAISPDPRSEVEEPGEIDMVATALVTLDLVTHDDAKPAFPAVHLEGRTVLFRGELAGLAGASGRVLVAAAALRTHECGADGYLDSAFRELLG
jgi:hypothetical protein